MRDGCHLSRERAACQQAYDGVLTKGTHGALLVLSDLLRELMARRTSPASSNATVAVRELFAVVVRS
jgi:hypothetical protein